MSIGFEDIVRPAQGDGIFSPRVALSTPSPIADPTTTTDEAKLVWNGSAGSDFVRGDEPDYPTFKVDDGDDFTEDKNERRTSTVRIENPDDPDQWVEVKRIDRMVFKKPVADRNSIAPDRFESLQIAAGWDENRK